MARRQPSKEVDYLNRGWSIIPIPLRQKAPVIKEWQELRLTSVEQLLKYFPTESNVGVLLGEPSGNLVDIDIDVMAARPFADRFLPSTLSFGRKSKPFSHRLYHSKQGTHVFAFGGKSIIELRASGQTVFPGSIHPSGEKVEWANEAAIAESEDLVRRVGWCAAGALISRYWPKGPGVRNHLAMALSGGMLNDGWSVEDSIKFIEALCEATGDKEVKERTEPVKHTAKKLGRTDTTGWPSVGEEIPKDAIRKIREWLSIEIKGEMEYELNDVGNANRFVARFRNSSLYSPVQDRWYDWTDRYWQEDKSKLCIQHAEEIRQVIKDDAETATNPKARKVLLEHAHRCGSIGRLESLLRVAQAYLAKDINDFDRDPELLNLNNGTFDLRTCSLREHNPADFLTSLIHLEYKPEAKAKRWEQFIQEIFDGNEELIGFVQRAIGYSLSGIMDEQVFFLLYGTGANGKSIFLNTVMAVLEEYAATAQSSTFMLKKYDTSTNDMARLKGKRFVITTEAAGGAKFDEEKIKQVVAGDKITARFLFQEFFEFTPQFKLWIACNHKPKVQGDDRGIWRRIRLIPFSQVFEGDRCDQQLGTKLLVEREGILRWIIDGFKEWKRHGLGRAGLVDAATEEYRSEMDNLGEFMAECCVINPKCQVNSGLLHTEFKRWTEARGEWSMTQTMLSLRLKERGIMKRHSKHGTKLIGIGLKDEKDSGM